jgi:hypothetical protein
MRLSYTPISLLHFFLVTFLALSLKPDAKAQTMLAVNVTRHHFESEYITEKYDGNLLNEGYPFTVNILHAQVPLLPIKNSRIIYSGYHQLPFRIYSASIPHSMQITVKFFKVIIAPLWYSR